MCNIGHASSQNGEESYIKRKNGYRSQYRQVYLPFWTQYIAGANGHNIAMQNNQTIVYVYSFVCYEIKFRFFLVKCSKCTSYRN